MVFEVLREHHLWEVQKSILNLWKTSIIKIIKVNRNIDNFQGAILDKNKNQERHVSAGHKIKGPISVERVDFAKTSSKNQPNPQCLKITEKVPFNIASEASYVYILSGQKLIKIAKKWIILGSFWKPEACGQTVLQTGQF